VASIAGVVYWGSNSACGGYVMSTQPTTWAYEQACAALWKHRERNEQIEAAAQDVIEAWDWWIQDEHDRCLSVPNDAIERLRMLMQESEE